jgi:hypothetical protein
MICTEWIKWEGGDMPVPEGALVDVHYRFGTTRIAVRAGQYADQDGTYPAQVWAHCNNAYDIVGYRAYYADKAEPKQKNVGLAIAENRVQLTIDLIESLAGYKIYYGERMAKVIRQLKKLQKEIEEDLG